MLDKSDLETTAQELEELRQKSIEYQEQLLNAIHSTHALMNESSEAVEELRVAGDEGHFTSTLPKSPAYSKERVAPDYFYRYDTLTLDNTPAIPYFSLLYSIQEEERRIKETKGTSGSRSTSQEIILLDRIREVVGKNEKTNWVDVSKTVAPYIQGKAPSPAECMKMYVQSKKPKITENRFWTSEEDKLLCETVRKLGIRNWQEVSLVMDSRSASECMLRWQKKLDPTIMHGKWETEEDIRLGVATASLGQNWTGVSHHVPGRTDLQCRERFCNILDTRVKRHEWTDEEDKALIKHVEKNGKKWAEVARLLQDRTDNQCMRRWKRLTGKRSKVEEQDDQEEFKAPMKKTKRRLTKNK